MDKKVLKLAKLAEPCQRNWDLTYTIPKYHLDYICKSATTMPTKQNKDSYELYCITNRNVIQKIFEAAYNSDDVEHTYLKNPQARANVLLIWTQNLNEDNDPDIIMNIGISAGAASLAAAELGYKTGFCKCFQVYKVREIISKDPSHYPHLILGFGKPDSRFDRRIIVEDGKKVGIKQTKGPKNIRTHYID